MADDEVGGDALEGPQTVRPARRRGPTRVVGVLIVAVLVADLVAIAQIRDRVADPGWERIALPVGFQHTPYVDVGGLAAPGPTPRWTAAGSILQDGRLQAVAWSSADGRSWQRHALGGGEGNSEALAVAGHEGRSVVVGVAGGPAGRREVAIWTASGDGALWIREDTTALAGPGHQDLRAVAAGPGGVLAAGRDSGEDRGAPLVVLSTDLATWRRVGQEVFGAGTGVEAVAPAPAGWVAVGWAAPEGTAEAAAWWSADGVGWERAEMAGAGAAGAAGAAGPVRAVTTTPGGLVALGDLGDRSVRQPVAWVSPDGRRWEQVHSGAFGWYTGERSTRGIRALGLTGPGPVVGVGQGANTRVWRSSDGLEWVLAELPSELLSGVEVRVGATDGVRTVVVVRRDRILELWLAEAEGDEWERVTDEAAFPVGGPTGFVRGVGRHGSTLLVPGREYAADGSLTSVVWRSADGRSWQRAVMSDGDINEIVGWRQGLVAVGDRYVNGPSNQAMVWTSADGASWDPVPTGQPGFVGDGRAVVFFTDVVEGGPGLVAAAAHYGPEDERDARVLVSADGRSWEPAAAPPAWQGPRDQAVSSLCRVGEGVLAVGHTDLVTERVGWAWWSTDGRIWQRVGGDRSTGGLGTTALPVACEASPAGGVVVGHDPAGAGEDAAVWRTTDGRGWVRVAAPALGGPGDQRASAVAVEGPVVVAAGTDGDGAAVWASSDSGVSWRRLPDPDGVLRGFREASVVGVAIVGDEVVVVGSADSGPVVWIGSLAG